MSDTGPSLMELDDVTKSFRATTVFRNVNLVIRRGSSTLIRGPSGCGKTTLLRCMALLEPIDKGTITLEGKIGSRDRSILVPRFERTKVGMVFQDLFLWPHLSVLDNIALPLYASGTLRRDVARQRATKLLEEFGIAEKADKAPTTLSGGQRQRVAIARALVHSPKLLLLDEITSNLDPEATQRVYSAIGSIWKEGTAVVLATHQSSVPQHLASQLATFVPAQNGWSLRVE